MTSWGSNSNSGSKLVSWFATLGRKKGKRLNQSTSALNAFSLNTKQNTIKGFKSASDLLDHSVSSNPDYASSHQTKRNNTAVALKNQTLSRNSVSSSVSNSVAGKDNSESSDKKRSLVSLTLDRKNLRKKRSTTWYYPPDRNQSSFSRLDSWVDQSSVSLSETALRDTDCDKNLKTEITRAHQLSLGCKKFNLEPKKGIEFLVQQGLLQETPHDVALFLYKGEGLGKTAIGEYLGEKHPFHEEVLREFVNLHDFSNLILVQALRQFLWSFRLPGEAQKIDRMMESFARRYCSQNPDIFSHTDTCYVLSFAVIMLNTNLHNPNVKDKLKVEQFVLMNRGIDSGNDLPEEMLQSLYESIKAEPFTIPEDDGNDLLLTFFNPVREGWLTKRGGRYKSWKRRWFILNDSCLYYFEHTTDKEPLGIIPLENIQVREISDRSLPNCFELYSEDSNNFLKACKTDSHGKVTKGRHLVYRMSACTPQEKDDWIDCLRRNTSHNPLAAAVAARKSRLQKTNY